ncbi:MAG TPA: LysR substrate-binding domain-containing protein [Armatimonadaceae bacterium]|nr:LysR substrate-binding domain-containing protein [Armatimonadaceae bacterium]
MFQLRYFVAAANRGNFSRAAEDVCVSQPSLSLQIANLEREVGVPLFARQGRSVRLTDAGVVLKEHAERILREEEEARRAVRAVVGLEQGRLSLWTLPTLGQHLLPLTLARFRQAHPGVEITLHEEVPARAVGVAVASGRADLGLVHLPCPVPGLARRELFTEELALVVPVGHRLARAAAAAPALADLAGEDFVWVPEGSTPEHPFYASCLAAGFSPRVACVSGSAQGMQALVAAGLGIALLPRLALKPPEGATVVDLAPPRPTRTLAVVWRENAPLSHAARTFLEMVTEDHERPGKG